MDLDVCTIDSDFPTFGIPSDPKSQDVEDDIGDLWDSMGSPLNWTGMISNPGDDGTGSEEDSGSLMPLDNDEWLDCLTAPQKPTVVNDCLFSSTSSARPHIKSEHSYSLGQHGSQTATVTTHQNDTKHNLGELEFLTEGELQQMEQHCTVAGGQDQEIADAVRHIKHDDMDLGQTDTFVVKQEPGEPSSTAHYTVSSSGGADQAATVLVRQSPTSSAPTIVVATSRSLLSSANVSQIHATQLVLPRGTVKLEPYDSVDEILGLPPTPPGSSGSCSSDSESGSNPGSPRHCGSLSLTLLHRQQQQQHQFLHSSSSSSSPYPNFSPIPQSGVLLLTEEEKRTLIQEGYPVPTKLPLTKQEEKNLKKIRRKIKNKISAQESRRKKKEYLETLEKKVEAFSQENHDLRRKMDNLENNNKSLMTQLHKLQALVRGRVTTTPSTGLMVLVLFFAVFLGAWSPASWSLGYSVTSGPKPVGLAARLPHMVPVGPVYLANKPAAKGIAAAVDDEPYATRVRSRTLLGFCEEDEYVTSYEPWGPHAPYLHQAAPPAPQHPEIPAPTVDTDNRRTAEITDVVQQYDEEPVEAARAVMLRGVHHVIVNESKEQMDSRAPLGVVVEMDVRGSEEAMVMRPDIVADLPLPSLNTTA